MSQLSCTPFLAFIHVSHCLIVPTLPFRDSNTETPCGAFDSLQPPSRPESDSLPDYLPSLDIIDALREMYTVLCMSILGEYLQVLGPVLSEKGIPVCITLLKRPDVYFQFIVLKTLATFFAHKKFCTLFVDAGGLQVLLEVPRVSHTVGGIAIALYGLMGIQVRRSGLGGRERVSPKTAPRFSWEWGFRGFFGAFWVFLRVILGFPGIPAIPAIIFCWIFVGVSKGLFFLFFLVSS